MLLAGVWLASFIVPSVLAAGAAGLVVALDSSADFARTLENTASGANIAVAIILVAGSLWAVRLLGGTPADIGWRRPESTGRSVLLGVGAGVGAWILFAGIGALLQLLFPDIDTLAPYRDSLENPVLVGFLLVGAVLFAPIGEELFWRGLFLGWLADMANRSARSGATPGSVLYSTWIPVLLTAVLWATVHFNFAAFLQLAIFGLLLGWLRVWDSGSLLMPVVAHATNNTLTMIGLLLTLSLD